MPTCRRVNSGCSFLDGEMPPEDVPGILEILMVEDWEGDSGE